MNTEAKNSTARGALILYEKAAEAERGAYMRLLPGREYPVPSQSQASTTQRPSKTDSESILLPTDPGEFDYLKKQTMITGITGGLTKAERNEERDQDVLYCEKNFPGHVVKSPLETVLARLGSQELVDKFTELKETVRTHLDANFKKDVLNSFTKEADSKAKPVINGRYWLARLADAAAVGDSPPLALDYFPTPGEPLALNQCHGYHKSRKYDAALRTTAAAESTILNICLNVEYTTVNPPNVAVNPLVGRSKEASKFQQAITNADDLLTFQPTLQPTRLFVPTLSFHGKGRNANLFVSILNQERLEFAVVPNCFDFGGFPTVSALLHLFRIASLYQLGYSPLFIYSLSLPPTSHGFAFGDVAPISSVIPDTPGVVRLTGKRLSQPRSTPFGRSTTVLEGYLEEQSPGTGAKKLTPVVLKLSSIDQRRQWRERIIISTLHSKDPGPPYAPKLLGAFAALGSPFVDSDYDHSETLPVSGRIRKASALVHAPTLVSRNLEVMLFASPHNSRKLKDLSVVDFLNTAEQLFRAILDAFRRRVLHRDVSINNILLAGKQLLLIDWEIGRCFDEIASAGVQDTITGTLDTMSMASLRGFPPLPHDDVESAIYALLKALTQNFVPLADQQLYWATILKALHWDNPDIDHMTLAAVWLSLWAKHEGSLSRNAAAELAKAGYKTSARLFLSLLSLPLPVQRLEVTGVDAIDSSNYDKSLTTLEDLITKAIVAIDAVRGSADFSGSWVHNDHTHAPERSTPPLRSTQLGGLSCMS